MSYEDFGMMDIFIFYPQEIFKRVDDFMAELLYSARAHSSISETQTSIDDMELIETSGPPYATHHHTP